MMAVYGNLTVTDDAAGDRLHRRFAMSPGAAEVLTDRHSLNYLGALPQMLAAVGVQLDKLLEAYRGGGGVSWGQLGDNARDSQAALNRPVVRIEAGACTRIGPAGRCHSSETSRPNCRYRMRCWLVDDRACPRYPSATVLGVDIDEPSIAAANDNAEVAGIADRARFAGAKGESLGDLGPFDAAFAFECLHDMPRPVEVLAAIHGAVRPDGLVVIMDEAVADSSRPAIWWSRRCMDTAR